MQEIVNPIGVELDETARRMRIRWDDGHLGEWSWLALRRACPCALCAGEGNLPGRRHARDRLRRARDALNEVRWIGRYALAPIWADGHDTGLFTYTKLRGILRMRRARRTGLTDATDFRRWLHARARRRRRPGMGARRRGARAGAHGLAADARRRHEHGRDHWCRTGRRAYRRRASRTAAVARRCIGSSDAGRLALFDPRPRAGAHRPRAGRSADRGPAHRRSAITAYDLVAGRPRLITQRPAGRRARGAASRCRSSSRRATTPTACGATPGRGRASRSALARAWAPT